MNQSIDTRSTRRPPVTFYLAPLVVMAVIFGLSSQSQLPDVSRGHDLQNVLGHFGIYAVLGASLAVLLRSLGWRVSHAWVAAVLIATLYGITDEFHQSFVPHRNADVVDLMVDAIGAMTGAAIAISWRQRRFINASSDADPTQPAAESFGRTRQEQ